MINREDGDPLLGFQRASIVQLHLKVIASKAPLPGALLPLSKYLDVAAPRLV